MSKFKYCGLAVLIAVIVTPIVYSQTFNFKPAASPTNRTNTPYSQNLLPVASAADFKSGVKSLSTEKQNNLDQKLKSSLKPLSVNAPSSPSPAQKSTEGNVPKITSGNVAPTSQIAEPPPVSNEEMTPPSSTAVRTPPPPPPSASQPPPPRNTQTYTGFGAGSSNSSDAKQPAGGGWNIKY